VKNFKIQSGPYTDMAAQGYKFSAAMSNECSINCFIY